MTLQGLNIFPASNAGLVKITQLTSTGESSKIPVLTSSGVLNINGVKTNILNSKSLTTDGSGNIVSSQSTLGINLPIGWNANYKAKLSQSSTSLVKIGLMGDSISAGSYCSNQLPNRLGTGLCNKLQSSLQNVYGDGGSGFVHVAQSPSFAGNNLYSSSVLPVNITNITYSFNASIGSTFAGSSTLNANAIFSAIRGTSVSVFLFVGPSNSTVVNVTIADGSTIISNKNYNTLNAAVGPFGGSTYMTEYIVTGLTTNEHTVTITNTASGIMNVVGVSGYNSTGIVINNFSVPGQSLTNCQTLNNANPTVGNIYDYSGGNYFNSLNSDLIIFSLLANDASTDPVTWKTNFSTLVKRYRLNTSQDFLVLVQNTGTYDSTNNLASDRMMMNSSVPVFGCGYIDINTILGKNNYQYAISQGFWSLGTASFGPVAPMGSSGTTVNNSNTIHPSDVGHAAIANVILPYLLSTY